MKIVQIWNFYFALEGSSKLILDQKLRGSCSRDQELWESHNCIELSSFTECLAIWVNYRSQISVGSKSRITLGCAWNWELEILLSPKKPLYVELGIFQVLKSFSIHIKELIPIRGFRTRQNTDFDPPPSRRSIKSTEKDNALSTLKNDGSDEFKKILTTLIVCRCFLILFLFELYKGMEKCWWKGRLTREGDSEKFEIMKRSPSSTSFRLSNRIPAFQTFPASNEFFHF